MADLGVRNYIYMSNPCSNCVKPLRWGVICYAAIVTKATIMANIIIL